MLLAYDIEGKVRLEPPFPEPVKITVSKEQQGDCGSVKSSPLLQISPEGYVANAVVKLEGDFPDTAPPVQNQSFVLDQTHCEFVPHVLLIPRGAPLSILNSEPFLHNVRAFDEKANMLFNQAMPIQGSLLKKTFEKGGRITLRCGVHHWMYALVIVQDHPYYALTDESGFFKLQNVPDGNHTLIVWHEALGEIRQSVNPQNAKVSVQYSAAK